MHFSYLSQYSSISIALVLFVLMVAIHLAGSRLSVHQRGKTLLEGFGPVQGSMLGLLALLLAFTFSMSASRYDARRTVLVEEANTIGTAVLRADLYPDSERTLFRADFKEYVEARIAFYQAGLDEEKVNAITKLSSSISDRLWHRASVIAQNRDSLIPSNNMVPALNEMIDIVTTRNATRQATVPDLVLWMLFLLCLISSFLVGVSITKDTQRSWVVNIVFAFMISACIFITVDLDRPSQSFITLEEANKNIVDLRGLFADGH